MKRLLLSALVLAGLAVAGRAIAQDLSADDAPAPVPSIVAGAIEKQPNAQIEFSDWTDDSAGNYLTLFTHNETGSCCPACKAMIAQFKDSPLSDVKRKFHWNHYTGTSWHMERFAGEVRTFPSVLVQRANGEVLLNRSGVVAGDKLLTEMGDCFRGRCKPRPEPKPEPPKPDLALPPPAVPDLPFIDLPRPPMVPDFGPAMLLGAVVGGLGAFVYEFKKSEDES